MCAHPRDVMIDSDILARIVCAHNRTRPSVNPVRCSTITTTTTTLRIRIKHKQHYNTVHARAHWPNVTKIVYAFTRILSGGARLLAHNTHTHIQTFIHILHAYKRQNMHMRSCASTHTHTHTTHSREHKTGLEKQREFIWI